MPYIKEPYRRKDSITVAAIHLTERVTHFERIVGWYLKIYKA